MVITIGVVTSPSVTTVFMEPITKMQSAKEARKNRPGLHPFVVRYIRRTRGAVAEIAAAAGVDHSFVSHVLSGRKRPSARLLQVIPDVLGGIGADTTRAALIAAQPCEVK